MRNKRIKYIILLFVILGGIAVSLEGRIGFVQAETVQYTYDSLGRVQTAIYPDRTKVTYIYDQNGNIRDVKKEIITTQQTESGGGTEGTGKTETPTTESSQGEQESSSTQTGVVTEDEGTTQDNQNPSTKDKDTANSVLRPSAKDVKAYNRFKKRKPTIKSLKAYKKKNKRTLKIQIPRLKEVGKYPETGYQIKCSTNSKFKKATTYTLARHKKKQLSTKTWKVKKNKTYYVKVRAYMRTKTGKKIYSKYSKVKKIKVQ